MLGCTSDKVPLQYTQLPDVPPQTLAYYRDCVQKGVAPKLYHHIPHVLIQGPLNTSSLLRVVSSEPPE